MLDALGIIVTCVMPVHHQQTRTPMLTNTADGRLSARSSRPRPLRARQSDRAGDDGGRTRVVEEAQSRACPHMSTVSVVAATLMLGRGGGTALRRESKQPISGARGSRQCKVTTSSCVSTHRDSWEELGRP
jgi:hypothetical protein